MRYLRYFTLIAAAGAGGCGSDSGRRDQARGSAAALPFELGPAIRVFAGTAALLPDGPACTAEKGAKGDRWCAFLTLSGAGGEQLFVANISRALAGAELTCAEEDPNCLLLTPTLNRDGFSPTWHRTYFQGDTLVYYDAGFAPHVWRPGMTSGQLLVEVSPTYDAAFCAAAALGTSVACLGLPSEQEDDTELIRGDLLAGKADGASVPLLSPIDSVIATSLEDQDGITRFSFGFLDLGNDQMAWTSRQERGGPEVLKLQTVGEPETQRTIASDVHDFGVSGDGSHWYWVSGINVSGSGSLQTAPFPDAEYPTELLANVVEYGIPSSGDAGVVGLTVFGDLAAIPDPAGAPAEVVMMDQGVQALLSFTDREHVAYAKHFAGSRLVDLFASRLDGTGVCIADTTVTVPLTSIRFSPNTEAAVWARLDLDTIETFDGHHTRLSDCTTTAFAPAVLGVGWLGHRAIIFKHALDLETNTTSLSFLPVGADDALSSEAPTLVAEHVDTTSILYASPNALLYTVNGGTEEDGVYLRSFTP